MEGLVLPCHCCEVGSGTVVMPPPLIAYCDKAGPQLIRAGELALPLASSSVQEYGPCASLGNTVELSLMEQVSPARCESKRACPALRSLCNT